MSNALIDAINKFLAWEKELVEVTSEQPRDGAERLGVVLYGKDDPVKLIGGCNAKIFHDAEAKISDLTERLAAAEAAARWLWPKVSDDAYDAAWEKWPWLDSESAKGGRDGHASS